MLSVYTRIILGAGPYGNPIRNPQLTKKADPVNGISTAATNAGLDFERTISLWRTTYSTVTQARSNLPNVIGAGSQSRLIDFIICSNNIIQLPLIVYLPYQSNLDRPIFSSL
jgi:hypothetical protein